VAGDIWQATPDVLEHQLVGAHLVRVLHGDAVRAVPLVRGLYSFTFQLNVSAFCGIGGAFRGY